MVRGTPAGAGNVFDPGDQEPDAIENRVLRQRNALLTMTAEQTAGCEQLPRTLSRIAEVTSATLAVPRVSIWRYNTDRTAIKCVEQYDGLAHTHASGASLQAADFPTYFGIMARSDVVAVEDAMRDARTSEFTDSYLRPLDIVSMMDVPIRLGGKMIGLLCHEQTGQKRHWSDDEKAFAVATSTLISLALERRELSRTESALALQIAALNAVAHPVVITDQSAGIVWVNPAFEQLTGYSSAEVVGQNSVELLDAGRHDDAFLKAIRCCLAAGETWRGEIWNRTKDGRVLLFDQTVTPVKDASGSVTHFVTVKVDLTEKRSLESQLLQAQKMEVVGRLAGGVAHDFNNLLTVINGSAELALSDLPPEHPLRGDFERIQESGNRAAALTRQLLAFSRRQITNRVAIDVGPVLSGFRGMLQRLIGEDIRLDVWTPAAPAIVVADESQIEQVILNLVINARDAMPRGGVIRVDTQVMDLDQAFAVEHKSLRPGPHVLITVTDNGEGMTPDVLSRAFEPFFTTKEQGKGTGLGLATVFAVVEQAGGAVTVSSDVGIGTSFRIYLPLADDAVVQPRLELPSEAKAPAAHILIVEDDDSVRELAVRILRSAGHIPIAAHDGASALEDLANQAETIDLVLTDVVLTDMGGRDLATRARIFRPDVPILYTSGYTDDVVLARGVSNHTAQFIPKPYTAPALTAKVREVLNRSRALAGALS